MILEEVFKNIIRAWKLLWNTDSGNTKGETKDKKDTVYYEAFILFWLLDQTGSLHI